MFLKKQMFSYVLSSGSGVWVHNATYGSGTAGRRGRKDLHCASCDQCGLSPFFDGTCSLLSAYVNTQKSKFRCFLSIYLKYLRMILSSILMIWLASNKSVAIYAGAKETLRHRPSAAIRIHVAALAKKANNYASRVTGKTAKLG